MQVAPLVGFAYGGFFSLYPLLTSQFFGMPHFGQNWVRSSSHTLSLTHTCAEMGAFFICRAGW